MQQQQQQQGQQIGGQSTVIRNFQSLNPTTGEVIATFPFLSDDEVNQKIERSWQAFQNHSQADLAIRSQKVLKFASLIEENAEKLGNIITQEMGKPLTHAVGEALITARQTRYYAENAERYLKPQAVTSTKKKTVVEYRPLGVIYYIIPFNFPVMLSLAGTIPSLLVGNTVLYRPADSTPRVGKVIEELMIEAGFTNGEFQTLFTSPDQLELVLANKHVRGVSFTGSTKAGRTIASIAGKYGKKAVLELGGSDPFIVLDDADIERAATAAIESRLFNTGQACAAAKRIILDENVYDRFKQLLLEKITEYQLGDPLKPETKLGPLARSDLRDNLERQVQEGQRQGAKLLYEGKKPEGPEFQKGNFFAPRIFEVENENNVLFREETFGPVFALMRVRGEEEITRIANDTEYGLGCSIFSKDLDRAQKLGTKIDAGMVVSNGYVYPDIPMVVPFGGVKGSGFGRQFSEIGMHEFANIKTVTTHLE